MDQSRVQPAERSQPLMQIPALLIAFVLAPGAALAVGCVVWPIAIFIGIRLGVLSPDGDPADKEQFLAPAVAFLCTGFWIVWLAVLLGFQMTRKLSLWTVVPPAIVLPADFVATVSLAGWAISGRNPAGWFITTSLLMVPITAALAIGFWCFYCFFTGEQLKSPPPWRKAVLNRDDIQ